MVLSNSLNYRYSEPCDKKGVPDGTVGPIDPSKPANYDIMNKLFSEIRSTFKDNFIHLGGDEVPFDCWQSNPDITAWMKVKCCCLYFPPEKKSRTENFRQKT